MSYKGMTALVTGASSGLGEEFARQLAALGANLVLVARSEAKLQRLAESLGQQFNVQAMALAFDLSSAEAIDRLISEIKSRGLEIDLLVNNAGLGVFEDFLAADLESQIEEVDVNVRAVVALTHTFAPGMAMARRGGVINIASTAAFQPLAGASIYAASKAFVLFFSEGLAFELEKSNVKVVGACPGPVATQFGSERESDGQAIFRLLS